MSIMRFFVVGGTTPIVAGGALWKAFGFRLERTDWEDITKAFKSGVAFPARSALVPDGHVTTLPESVIINLSDGTMIIVGKDSLIVDFGQEDVARYGKLAAAFAEATAEETLAVID